ncbi:phosphotransferase [Asanoa sp. NPDC049518]|uniref:phosphotransferase family protein n=1 Tax=unclassified Asanoa TaxID=2685164 RepID=UPI003446AA85
MEHLLNGLGYDPQALRSSTTLAGSASGAVVARIRLGEGEFVVKATTEREAAFYRAGKVVPVRVPRVVAADGTCLLFDALTPVAPATAWPASRWHEVARQLGQLHHARVRAAVGHQSWLKQPSPTRHPDATARAFWTDDELATPVDSPRLPPCLIHGDLHAGNLLIDHDRELVWADWQEVGIGSGPEDLALLWQRAEADGADPPREAMLATYAAGRGIPCDDDLRKAVAAAEVRLLLLDWPPFLINADPARAAIMRRRLHLLRQRQ